MLFRGIDERTSVCFRLENLFGILVAVMLFVKSKMSQ